MSMSLPCIKSYGEPEKELFLRDKTVCGTNLVSELLEGPNQNKPPLTLLAAALEDPFFCQSIDRESLVPPARLLPTQRRDKINNRERGGGEIGRTRRRRDRDAV